MYLADLWEVAKSKASSQKPVWRDVARRLINGHGEYFRRKSLAKKRLYEHRAATRAAAKQAENIEDLEHVRAEIKILDQRIQEAKDNGDKHPLMLSQCTFDKQTLDLLSTLMKSPDFSAERVNLLRAASKTAPEPWQGPEDAPEDHKTERGFLPKICLTREHFVNTVLLTISDIGLRYFKVVFADQQPYYVGVAPLRLVGPVVFAPEVEDQAGKHLAEQLGHWRWIWKIDDWFRLDSLADHRDLTEKNVSVISGIMHLPGGHVGADAEPIALSEWFSRFPPPERADQDARGQEGGRGSAQQQGSDQVPKWVLEHLAAVRKRGKERAEHHRAPQGHMMVSSSSSENEAASDDDGEDGFVRANDDADIDSIYRELEDARAAYAAEMPIADLEFKVMVDGGPSAYRRYGAAVRGYVGQARGDLAKEFCRLRNVPMSGHYAVSRSAFDETTAALLARSWCHRSQYLFDLAVAKGDLAAVASLDEIEAYEEPTELTRLAAETPARNVHTHARIAQLRALR